MGLYPTPPGDSTEPIAREFKRQRRELREGARPDGTNIAQLVQKVRDALVNINATVVAAVNSYLSTGTVTMNNLNATGRVTSADALRSPGSRVFNMTSGWAGAWINFDGTIGISTSSERFKENIRPLDKSTLADAVYEAVPVTYERIGTDITEMGFIAERFVEIGLGAFVFHDAEGQVEGIHYDRISIALVAVVQQQRAQIAALDERLAALENPTA